MKTKFTTVDIMAITKEVNEGLVGMRVSQVYDVDHRTYLIKLQKPDCRRVLLLESGCRLHPTDYEWPKHPAPSGFAMKLRKHVRNKRLEQVRQLGVDRVVDLQFGSEQMACHLIVEIYDRGNLVLTDHEYTILNILRPRTDTEQVKFAVRERYPVEKCRQFEPRSEQLLQQVLAAAQHGTPLRKVINPHLDFGSALIDHTLLECGVPLGAKLGVQFDPITDLHRLVQAVDLGQQVLRGQVEFQGVVTFKAGKKRGAGETEATTVIYDEFHPLLYRQHSGEDDAQYQTFVSFSAAVDEFFSQAESHRLDSLAAQQERDAMKKLDNVRNDHQRRLETLELCQRDDRWRAELITRNAALVDGASLVVRSAVAQQMNWRDIERLVRDAQKRSDPVASRIKALKLAHNRITMLLSDPYVQDLSDSEDKDDDDDGAECSQQSSQYSGDDHIRPMLVDIDLGMSTLSNAGRFYDLKRSAAKKHQKTVQSSMKALKSAEQKTHKQLKEVAVITSIHKARKVHWFEKFLWFISSENYLVLGGRDQQQNELLVRRYLRPGDVYVHADLHGAASLIVKNWPAAGEVPPKTLHEAGTFAVSNSSAWEAKMLTSAWWVYWHQVSKTAPTGEYLTTGSFMVRGKKNYLPPCHLALGLAVLFKLEASSVGRHRGERRVRVVDGDDVSSTHELMVDLGSDSDDVEQDSVVSAGVGQDSLTQASVRQVDEKEKADIKEAVGIGEDGAEFQASSADSVGADEASFSRENDTGETVDDAETAATAQDEPSSCGDEEDQFPDTTLHLKHLQSGSVMVLASSEKTAAEEVSCERAASAGQDKLAADRRRNSDSQRARAQNNTTRNTNKQQQQQQVARGKRTKMKRAQAKYKDQDDEERQARMALLQPDGKSKAEIAREKRDEELRKKQQRHQQQQLRKQQQQQQQMTVEDNDEEDDGNDDEEASSAQDSQLLDELTGMPVEEDELLFALPICAPYSTLQSYKFKAKLTPGPMKKGRAIKQLIQVFSSSKTASGREVDLIRSLKVEDAARNIPGKVKLSVAQSARPKKR